MTNGCKWPHMLHDLVAKEGVTRARRETITGALAHDVGAKSFDGQVPCFASFACRLTTTTQRLAEV